jgi:hypothetical protein
MDGSLPDAIVMLNLSGYEAFGTHSKWSCVFVRFSISRTTGLSSFGTFVLKEGSMIDSSSGEFPCAAAAG